MVERSRENPQRRLISRLEKPTSSPERSKDYLEARPVRGADCLRLWRLSVPSADRSARLLYRRIIDRVQRSHDLANWSRRIRGGLATLFSRVR